MNENNPSTMSATIIIVAKTGRAIETSESFMEKQSFPSTFGKAH
jgi:hypothetical protein